MPAGSQQNSAIPRNVEGRRGKMLGKSIDSDGVTSGRFDRARTKRSRLQTFCRWKKKCAGPGIAELWRLRRREEENRKLEHLSAEPRTAAAQNIRLSETVKD